MSRIRANKITNKAGTGAVELEKGAHLPTGIGITGAGSINLSGVITATSFSGNGAGLTGIDATSIKDPAGNVKIQAQASGAVYTGIHTFTSLDVGSNIKLGNAGVITATSFAGDGSNLTGVTQSDTPIACSTPSTVFYESDDETTITEDTTLARASSNSGVIYTKFQQIVVAPTKSLIVDAGETLVVDVYGMRTPDV